MHRLLLVRHAQSEWNALGRWQGVADPDLSAIGRQQAAVAGAALAAMLDGEPVVALVASDLRRAVATASALGAAVGWPGPPIEVHGLREHDVGEWSGLTRPEIERRWPGMLAAWSADPDMAAPGGELRSAFDLRVRAALEELGRVLPDGLSVGVSHGGVLRSIGRWLGRPGHVPANLEGHLLDLDAPAHLGDVHLLAAEATPAPTP